MVGSHRAEAGQRAYFEQIGLDRNEFDVVEDFFHDLPEPLRTEALSQPEPRQSDTPCEQPWPLDRWPDIPTRVVAGRDDRLFPLEFQRRVVRERLGLDVEVIPGGHLVALSQPEALAERIWAYRATAGIGQSMDLERILRETRSVAIVGASAHPWRASHEVWTYLKSASDYELYLVNPTISEVDGTPVYPSLTDLPVVPDLVDVFRRPDYLPSVLDETIKVGAKTLWLQLGLRHEQVGRDGAAAGLQMVMDRCLKVDHARLLG